jgi:hypothetical protein
MPRTARVQVLLEGDEAERFEEYCRERGFKKSTLIARLVREHLDREAFFPQRRLFTAPKQQRETR